MNSEERINKNINRVNRQTSESSAEIINKPDINPFESIQESQNSRTES